MTSIRENSILKEGKVVEYFNEDPGSNDLNISGLFEKLEGRVHNNVSHNPGRASFIAAKRP